MYQQRRSLVAMVVVFASLGSVVRAGFAGTEKVDSGIQAVVSDLGSDDFAVREKAIRKLQAVVSDRAKIYAEANDPEVRAAMQGILEFDVGMTRYLLYSAKVPEAQRRNWLELSGNKELASELAGAFESEPSVREKSIVSLGKSDEPTVSLVLAELINADDRQSSLAAMEALWDREPTDVTTAALWSRAVLAELNPLPVPEASKQETLTFRGQTIYASLSNANQRRSEDNNIAFEVLTHTRPAALQDHLQTLFDMATSAAKKGYAGGLRRFSGSVAAMRNAYHLTKFYDVKPLIADFYQLATCASVDGSAIPIGPGLYMSNRTMAIQYFLQATGQKLGDYHLNCLDPRDDFWVVASEADEKAAVAAIQKWWGEHAKEFDVASASTAGGAVTTGSAR